jgi:integrase
MTVNSEFGSLGDVLRAIKSNATLSDRRRQDLSWGVHTIARAIGRKPEEIEAHPQRLGLRLKSVAPIPLGLSTASWNNARCLLGSAMRLVRPVMPARDKTPRSEAWEALYRAIGDRRTMKGYLSRITRWLPQHQIAPEDVTLSNLEDFRFELMQQALLSDPEGNWRETVRAWNSAVKTVPGWPSVTLPVVSRKVVYVKPWNVFPASLKQDVDNWLRRISNVDLDDEGPLRPVKPSTVETRDYQLRAFASALVLRGKSPETLSSLAFCLTIDNFKEGLRFFVEQHNERTETAYQMATMLIGVARYWVKADLESLERMQAIARRLAPKQRHGLKPKNRERLRPLEDQEKLLLLLRLPEELRKRVETGKGSLRRQRYLAEAAVAIEILLFAPLRIGNLAALDLDRHLKRVGKVRHLIIPSEEVKNAVDLEFELLPATSELINWYVDIYRMAPAGVTALFPGTSEASKSVSGLRHQIMKVIHEFTGLDINPHLFRHMAAKTYLAVHPGHYETVRRLLGHKSIETTTNSYTGLETRAAALHFATEIDKLRTSARLEAK